LLRQMALLQRQVSIDSLEDLLYTPEGLVAKTVLQRDLLLRQVSIHSLEDLVCTPEGLVAKTNYYSFTRRSGV